MEPFDDRVLLLDTCIVVAVSAAICLWSRHLDLMTVLVPTLLVARMGIWAALHRGAGVRGPRRRSRQNGDMGLSGQEPKKKPPLGVWREAGFLLICTVMGGFNDWNSVVAHGIYDYTVPHYFPAFTSIPIWMLLFWGMILRALASLGRWSVMGKKGPSNRVRLPGRTVESAWLKVGLMLGLVFATRQAIYQWYLHPVLSWLPFALAGVFFVALFGLQRRDLLMAALMLTAGPVIEIVYIQVGGLHRYHLGWLGGVPVWIALWWVVAVLVWADISDRLRRALSGSRASAVADMPG